MSDSSTLILIVTMSLVTIVIRFAPFLLFKGKKTPVFINYLGKVLPYSIIAMLVIYCVKGVSLINKPHGLPEIIAILAVVGLHIWKRNTLISIVLGTIIYMILKQIIFI